MNPPLQKNPRLMEAEGMSRCTKTFRERQGGAAVTPSFKPVTGAFTSYGAGGRGGERTGDRTALPAGTPKWDLN